MKEILSQLKFDAVGSYIIPSDVAVDTLVSRQAESGLMLATDGVERCDTDFFVGFDGLEGTVINSGRVYQDYPVMTTLLRMTGKLAYNSVHPLCNEFVTVKAACDNYGIGSKVIIPAPSTFLSRLFYGTDWNGFYQSADDMAADVAAVYGRLLRDLYDAGCRFVQMNDTTWTHIASDAGLKELLQGGIDVGPYMERLVKTCNEALAEIPDDMVIALLVGGKDSEPSSNRRGHNLDVASRWFGRIDADVFYISLNVDSDNDYAFLHNLPADKRIMLGIVSPAGRTSLSEQFIADNLAQASKIYPLSQLGITFSGSMSHDDIMLPAESVQWEIVKTAVDEVNKVVSMM